MAGPGPSSSTRTMEQLLMERIRKNPEGIYNDDLADLQEKSTQGLQDAINALLASHRIQLLQSRDNKLMYKEIKTEDMAKHRLSREDALVLQVIKSSANSGMWTKDMRGKTNMAQPQITKILKTLEGKGLIKSVKSVNNPSRKLYMLADLEPSREITGGAWYTENQFDAAFIDELRTICLAFIRKKGGATLAHIAEFIRDKGITKVDLQDDDVGMILRTLQYDGTLDETGVDDDTVWRPAVLSIPERTAITSIPCGVCPVFHECREDGLISPQTCTYYQAWLDF